jgi:leucyl-tRNA synthetase
MIAWLESKGIGSRKINYRLRDWLFSRQRYWGEPFPIVYDEAGHHYPVGERALPVVLPRLEDYTPPESDEPVPLLAKAAQWIRCTASEAGVSPDVLPPETPVRRETNTMPGWAGSCWYYLRYCDPKNDSSFCSKDAQTAWMGPEGVDLYIGGAEHAVLHLLYARFWHKMLYDLGEVESPEPFRRLFHQGLITSHAYQRADKSLVPTDLVEEVGPGRFVEKATGTPVSEVIAKMSKSLKNVVNPDEIIAEFGADTFRLYEMYMGPLDATKPWNTRDISGMFRFLQRAWRLVIDETTGKPRLRAAGSDAVERQLHKAILKVEQDIDRLAMNTAIASLIEFVNTATKAAEETAGHPAPALTLDQAERFALVMAPFVPHFSEELWSLLGHRDSLAHHPWPVADPALAAPDTIEIPVQVLGKVRSKVHAAPDATESELQALALADEKIRALIDGKTIRKVIVVPGRLVNIVAN